MEQGQQIVELYQILLSQEQVDPELINGAQNQLIELYKLPETLEILFNIYSQAPNRNIQIFTLIGIKSILSNNKSEIWNLFRENNQSENIKGFILQILQSEQDPYVFENAAAAASPILKTDFETWPEYLELIQAFSTNSNKFLFSIIMSNLIVRRIDEESDFLSNTWDFFTNLAMQGLSSSDTTVIRESAYLVANLFNFAAEIDTNLPELFSSLFQVLSEQMEAGSEICGKLVEDFESIALVPDFYFPNTDVIAEHFFTLIANSELDIDFRCLLISPLISFLFSDPESDKSQYIISLYDIIFALSSSSFVEDDCKENQSNMLTCNDAFERMLRDCEGEEVRQILIERGTGESTSGEIIAYGLSLISFAKIYPELLLHDISSCLNFGFACIETEDHAVQETVFELLSVLFSRQNDAFFAIQDHFFNIAFQVFAFDHPPLLTKVLECIYNYIEFVAISPDHVDNLFQALFQVLKEYEYPDIQSNVVDCFTNLAISLSDSIIPYTSALFPILIQASTEMNNPEEAKLKASAVECLGMLIKYVSEQSDIEQILQIFCGCIGDDDPLLISAGFRSLTNTLESEISMITQVLPDALRISLSIIQSEPTFIDDEDDDDRNDQIYDYWSFTMDFIREVAKKVPESLRDCLNDFKEALYKLIQDECDEEIVSISLKTASTIIRVCSPEETVSFLTDGVIETLSNTFSPKIAALCMNIISKFIRKQKEYEIEIPEEIINATCDFGIRAMVRDLEFQDDKKQLEFDVDFLPSVYMFFIDVASTVPLLFPMNDFYKSSLPILESGVEIEQADVINVFRAIYVTNHENIPNIQKKKIIQQFVEKLEICDCDNLPYPIAAVRTVVDLEPELIEKHIQVIMEFIDQLLSLEYEDQSQFYITMDYADSLLFSLFSSLFKENFDVEKYLKKMLDYLPATSDHIEASNIYSNLVFLCGEYPAVMGRFSSEVVRILAQTFALKDKEWKTIILPDDILIQMAILLHNLISSMKQGEEMLEAYVPDDLAKQRFQQRFTACLPS